MNRDWVQFHLKEARDALTATLREIEADPEYEYGDYWPAMQHVYHHLNTAWNARDAAPSQVAKVADADFNRWSGFPTDLPPLGVKAAT